MRSAKNMLLWYTSPMTNIEQFLSDAKKIIKHERADNGGRYDGRRACQKIGELFERTNRTLGDLPHSITDYWQNTYIAPSADAVNEPTEANLNKLVAFYAFLMGEQTQTDALTHDDWKNLQELVNYEADDLPLDALEAMMGAILEQGAL